MNIDHCVCINRSFRELGETARREGLSLDQLAECTGATEGCGMCRPYVRRMLRTGQTVFHEILTDDPSMEDGSAA